MTAGPDAFRRVRHDVDFAVVGGGMAGFCAALAAARRGARVALMHDRPVLGGNASSECRVHIGGADRSGKLPHRRETGIIEEVRLENLHRNPQQSYSISDLILHEKLRAEPNLTLLLNCSCLDARMDGPRIASVLGWQTTTQTYHEVRAALFADCSGDAVLAPLTGADHRVGREARSEYGETIAPEQADSRTMGMTCMFFAREHDTPQSFTPPSWACRFERDEDLPYGAAGHRWFQSGYWWIELGGEHDSIHDTETLRDELLRIALGVWDHIKNHGDHGVERWALDWLQFLPAKRESRRYLGDHVLTQCDIESEGRFEDVVAYGGWSMDDHHPAGFHAVRVGAPATIFHPAPSPYGIPYRCLYSRNVENLFFAGRCASCTHAAMSSTRVMATACVMGQAVGTAAALAAGRGLSPRGVGAQMGELQQGLLWDDAYLPGVPQRFGPLTTAARLVASQGNPEPLRDGVNRQVGDDAHAWVARPGDSAAYLFDGDRPVDQATLILDSAMDMSIAMSHLHAGRRLTTTPAVMPRDFRLEGLVGEAWTPLAQARDNPQRLVRLPLRRSLKGVRFVLERAWGASESRVYAFYLDGPVGADGQAAASSAASQR
jgi:hypothetical protein